eukprot:jgi/Ulvmu1/6954/UM033_0011.1
MRIASWDDFAERAKKMYLDEPLRTRYVVRYNHSQGKFCAKVTDDVKCIQFKSDQATDAKKLDELNTFFLSLMAGMDPEEFARSCAAGEQPTQPPSAQPSSTKRNKRKQ